MDYYLDFNHYLQRLNEEYKKYGKLIIAYDYDDTVYDFHKQGRDYQQVIDVLKRWKEDAYFIVYSASEEKRYAEMKAYLDTQGISYDTLNENIPYVSVPMGNKLYYNVLLDDRAGLDMPVQALNVLMDKIEADRQLKEACHREETP